MNILLILIISENLDHASMSLTLVKWIAHLQPNRHEHTLRNKQKTIFLIPLEVFCLTYLETTREYLSLMLSEIQSDMRILGFN